MKSDGKHNGADSSIEALRETLANAFVHRDYSIGGGSVNVALYDDRLEIISIGDLHFGLTPEALFREHESKPWNPMIAHTFYRRGIIETWGRGTLKISRLVQEAGHPPPVLSRREGAVVMSFELRMALQKTSEKTSEKASEKTPDAIIRLLGQYPELSAADVWAKLGNPPRAIEHAIEKLRKTGRLIRVGPDKGGHWKVNEG
jgi:ATP-dependent DNA helicase RecG